MKSKDKKILIGIIAASIIMIIGFLLVQGLLKPHNKTKSSGELGEITKTADDYDYTLEYVPQYDEVIENLPVVFTCINDISPISDNVTLMALESLDKSLSEYLMNNGYEKENYLTLTINEDSVVDDRSYPYFEMTIDGTGTVVSAVYDLPTYTWKFRIK